MPIIFPFIVKPGLRASGLPVAGGTPAVPCGIFSYLGPEQSGSASVKYGAFVMQYADILGKSRKISRMSFDGNILIPSLNENCKFSIINYSFANTTALESKTAMGYGLERAHGPWPFIFRQEAS
jgi:hypothetical protein